MPDTQNGGGWKTKLLDIALGVAAALCLMLVTGLQTRVAVLEDRLRTVEIDASSVRAELKSINDKLEDIRNSLARRPGP